MIYGALLTFASVASMEEFECGELSIPDESGAPDLTSVPALIGPTSLTRAIAISQPLLGASDVSQKRRALTDVFQAHVSLHACMGMDFGLTAGNKLGNRSIIEDGLLLLGI